MREVVLGPQALEDMIYWANANPKLLKKILLLIDSARKTPFEGLGQPEPLKHKYQGYWSRRIDDEHRLIYQTTTEAVFILQCRYHY